MLRAVELTNWLRFVARNALQVVGRCQKKETVDAAPSSLSNNDAVVNVMLLMMCVSTWRDGILDAASCGFIKTDDILLRTVLLYLMMICCALRFVFDTGLLRGVLCIWRWVVAHCVLYWWWCFVAHCAFYLMMICFEWCKVWYDAALDDD